MSVTVAAGRAALNTLRLAHELETTGATPTPEQAQQLASWTGWGILSPAFAPHPEGSWADMRDELLELLDPARFHEATTSLDVSFFTPAPVVDSVWELLGAAGFTGGRVLEPGCGTGALATGAPGHLDVDFHGIERDSTSAAIASLLHPGAEITNKALQDVHLRAGHYDAVIGNFPFSSEHVWDPAGFSAGTLHEYFLRRSLAALRPGGYLVAITSGRFMDSSAFSRISGDGGQVIGAIRLPEEAFTDTGATVVSDILIIRKAPDGAHGCVLTPETFTIDGAPYVHLHGWWREHPELVVGEFAATGFYQRPVTVRCSDVAGALAAAVASARELIAAQPMTANTLIPQLEAEAVSVEGFKEGSFQIIAAAHGAPERIVRVVDGVAEPVARASKRLRALVELRDKACTLLEAEADTTIPDELLTPMRTATLDAYQAYVSAFGPINSGTLHEGKEDPETGLPALSWRPVKLDGFRTDPDFHLVAALEVYDQETNASSPAPILTRRINRAPEPITSAATAAEALAVSLGETGALDLARIASLLGLPGEQEAVGALGDLVYADPAWRGAWVTARDYLSGNVREKLETAVAAAKKNPDYTRNVTALEAVVPADLGPAEIRVSLGVPWVRPEDYKAFALEVLGATYATVAHSPQTASWEVEGQLQYSHEALTTYGVPTLDPLKLLGLGMNNKVPVVKVYDFTLDREVRDPAATAAAQDKLEAIRTAFSAWIWEDAERSARLCQEYNRRFRSHVARATDGSYLKFPTMSSTITPYWWQYNIVDRIISAPAVLCGHTVGAGKAQPMDAKILTPTGFRRMADFMVGDEVIAPDGTTTRVNGVFPQGPKDLYRVTFNDGSTTECNDEHLWSVTSDVMLRWGKEDSRVMTLREIVDSGLGGRQLKWSIPQAKAADFDCGEDRPVDPYMLGLLLGDGNVTNSAVYFCSADQELVDAFRAALPEGCELIYKDRYDYRVRSNTQRYGSSLVKSLRDLGVMGQDALHKSIPHAYKEAPVAERLAVLQGLLDTDGDTRLRKSRAVGGRDQTTSSQVTYATGSLQLAKDVIWLVQSLGGTAGRKAIPSPKSVNGTMHYRVHIKLPADFVPFRLARKADKYAPAEKYLPKRFIQSVEHIGSKPMQCISVEHPDHLYVTDNFIVTHNTLSMSMAAVGLRQFGLANKPLIVVPNHLLEQISREMAQAFPLGKFLVATKEDLAKDRRRAFAARAATGDWDAIVMTHNSFTSLPVHPAVEHAWIQEQVDDLKASLYSGAGTSSYSSRQISKKLRSFEGKLAKLRSDARTDDDQVYFESLGVDYIAVDEAHYMKRLDVGSRLEGFSMGASKRATDLMLKTSWLRETRPGKPVLGLFTATPLTNSLVEIFVWQKFIQPEVLAAAGVDDFNAWAPNFVHFSSVVEVSPEGGGFRTKTRPLSILNVPELYSMFSLNADLLSADDIELQRPDADVSSWAVEQSELQLLYTQHLVTRAEKVRSGKSVLDDGTEDMMLRICGDGRRAALDPRLVGVEEDSPKITALAEQVARIHAEHAGHRYGDSETPGSLQLIFCDQGTPHPVKGSQTYGRIRAALIGAGVPETGIRWIHEATDDKSQAALFSACRDGSVSVLIGSTEKMGTGTNVQRRLVAVHHADAPWRPSDIEQREGRALRPGNLNESVEIHRYVVEGSFDAYQWQILETKAKSFAAMTGAADPSMRELADISEVAPSYTQMKALATGNPMLLRQAEVADTVSRLTNLRAIEVKPRGVV